MKFRDLGAQYEYLKNDIDSAIAEVLNDSNYISGKQVSILEEMLAEYVGVSHCITCGNGTDALQLSLMTWGIGPGDAVFVPDFTFFSSGEVVSAVGATPVFVDVDKSTFNIDSNSLAQSIEAIEKEGILRPRVVIAVDLYGLPANYRSIKKVCEQKDILILEDGAQGFGGMIGSDRACSFGDISTTSFFPAKPLGCYGDGGAIFTNNGEWAALAKSLAIHGKGSSKYDNLRIGMNSRLDTLQAAVLIKKLPHFADYEVDAANRIADHYDDSLKNTDLELPSRPDDYLSSWAQYTVLLPEEISRMEVQRVLKERNIPTMVYYPKPMHEQEAFSGRHMCIGCPNTVDLCNRVLSLPMGPYMTRHDVEIVCAELIKSIGER